MCVLGGKKESTENLTENTDPAWPLLSCTLFPINAVIYSVLCIKMSLNLHTFFHLYFSPNTCATSSYSEETEWRLLDSIKISSRKCAVEIRLSSLESLLFIKSNLFKLVDLTVLFKSPEVKFPRVI